MSRGMPRGGSVMKQTSSMRALRALHIAAGCELLRVPVFCVSGFFGKSYCLGGVDSNVC